MRRGDVQCRPGFGWWSAVLLALAIGVVVVLDHLGVIDFDASYRGLPPAVMFLLALVGVAVGLASWRRYTASDQGLVIERIGRRRVVPWTAIARPRTRAVEPHTFGHSPYEHAGIATEPGMHITTLRDHDGRVICRLGPTLSNRTAFMIAVHRRLRALDDDAR